MMFRRARGVAAISLTAALMLTSARALADPGDPRPDPKRAQPNIILIMGDDIRSEVWGSGLTAGQSTPIVRNTTSASAQGDTTKERTVVLKITTVAATYAGSGKVGHLLGLVQA